MCDALRLSNGGVYYNHVLVNRQYPADTVASIICDLGYHLEGSYTRICQTSGTWTQQASCRQSNFRCVYIGLDQRNWFDGKGRKGSQ